MAAAAQPQPQGGGAPPGAQAPQQQTGDPSQQQAAQMLNEFRPLADTIQQLGKKYPEGQEQPTQMLKALEGWMTRVAGNPQRTPQAQAPPNA